MQAQVDAAAAEIERARVELGKGRPAAEGELTAARRALAALSAPPSPTPLADRLGVAAWLVDLVHSALGSLAANGLACGLLVFGAHQPDMRRAGRVEDEDNTKTGPEPLVLEHSVTGELSTIQRQTVRKRVISKKKHAAQFAVERLHPAERGGSELSAIHQPIVNGAKRRGLSRCQLHR